MQSMLIDAGIDKKVVNHSGRVYCCSTLYNAWFEEQEVMKRSGHRSSTVRTYKRASAEKEREMSDVLSPPAPKTQCEESEQALSIPTSSSIAESTKAESTCSIVLRLTIQTCINKIIISKNIVHLIIKQIIKTDFAQHCQGLL